MRIHPIANLAHGQLDEQRFLEEMSSSVDEVPMEAAKWMAKQWFAGLRRWFGNPHWMPNSNEMAGESGVYMQGLGANL